MSYFDDKLPLEGVTVIETAQGVSGPYAGKLLGALGARIIKVELPEGDWSRNTPPFINEAIKTESSALLLYNKTDKITVVYYRAV